MIRMSVLICNTSFSENPFPCSICPPIVSIINEQKYNHSFRLITLTDEISLKRTVIISYPIPKRLRLKKLTVCLVVLIMILSLNKRFPDVVLLATKICSISIIFFVGVFNEKVNEENTL